MNYRTFKKLRRSMNNWGYEVTKEHKKKRLKRAIRDVCLTKESNDLINWCDSVNRMIVWMRQTLRAKTRRAIQADIRNEPNRYVKCGWTRNTY